MIIYLKTISLRRSVQRKAHLIVFNPVNIFKRRKNLGNVAFLNNSIPI